MSVPEATGTKCKMASDQRTKAMHFGSDRTAGYNEDQNFVLTEFVLAAIHSVLSSSS